jgi:hypothetical protein
MGNACLSGAVNVPKRGEWPRHPKQKTCLQCGEALWISCGDSQRKKFCNNRCATNYNMGLKQRAMRDQYGPCLQCHALLYIPSTQSAARLGVSRTWVLLERNRHGYAPTPLRVACMAQLWEGTHKQMLSVEQRVKKTLRGQAARIKAPIKQLTGKSYKTIELLGCSYAEARQWIEAKFKRGMGWHNTGEWEIDHVIPIAAFDLSNPAHIVRVNHYSNLQPLWKEENRAKSDRLPVGQLFLV